MKNLTIYILVIVIGCLLILLAGKGKGVPEPVIKTVEVERPMSIIETQQALKAEGFYKGKLDGKWGAQTERAYCDWAASREFERWTK